MAFKLVIADTVEIPVKFSVNDAGKTRSFFFHLTAPRVAQDALRDVLKDDELTVKAFLQERVSGWRGQHLVVNDDGQPAEFSPEAFACMLSLVGMEGIVYSAYLRALASAESDAGKAKN